MRISFPDSAPNTMFVGAELGILKTRLALSSVSISDADRVSRVVPTAVFSGQDAAKARNE